MQTKTYFANSVPAALEVARQELGENALLVSSRPTPALARQFGRLEVTFAWEPKQAAAVNSPGPVPAVSEIEEVRKQLSALRTALDRGLQLSGTETAHFVRGEGFAVSRLMEAGFTRAMAEELATGANRRPEAGSVDGDAALLHEIQRRIPAAPFTEVKPGETRTLAFIGPPGRGKTSSLIKIAVSHGLAKRVPVRIYCAGSHSIGAQEQLARMAAILGTPYQAFESLASLHLALNGNDWKGLILIDTPGMAPRDRSEMEELEAFFARRPEIEKHLVLRAEATFADLTHTMSRFDGLSPSRLLFTGMDEAAGFAPVVEALIRGGVPATFTGTGQQIPEDLEVLNIEKLARSVLRAPDSQAMPRGKFALAAA